LFLGPCAGSVLLFGAELDRRQPKLWLRRRRWLKKYFI
jgi:hypothetical protein